MLLDDLGEPGLRKRARPHISLEEIDRYASFLQHSAIEKSTSKVYKTGAHDYISFCVSHHLSLQPTPLTLSHCITFSSHSIASTSKYLTGASHYLKDLYPNFDTDRSHPLVLSTCYDFSYFALFTYVFSLFLEVSHGAAALTHFSLTHIAATLLTHRTAVVLTHSIAILIALPHWCSIYSGQSCRLFFS